MRIKLFVDAHVFDGIFQGTTTYIKGLYNALVEDDKLEITLAAENITKLKQHFTDSRFKFISLPGGSKVKRLLIDIPAIIRMYKYDYAHFQYVTPLIKECKYINTIHDLLFLEYPEYFPFSYRFTKKYTFKYSALRSDLICTVSNYSKKALVKYFKIDEDKIIVTPNAIDEFTHGDADVKKEYGIGKYILFVSRFEPRKNHYLLLKAFVELKLYTEYKLILIGRRNDVKTDAFDKYAGELPVFIKDSILYYENVSVDVIKNFYEQADLFIYPSAAEGFGIPPLEAAVAPCKVLCSNKTAMEDFDFFGKYLFDPGDFDNFKKRILEILNDQNYPFNEIANAVAIRYDWKIIAKNFSEQLKNIEYDKIKRKKNQVG